MKPFACKIKEKFFHPVPVFGQLVAHVRQANVERVIRKTKADKYSKKFKSQTERETEGVQSLGEFCAITYNELY